MIASRPTRLKESAVAEPIVVLSADENFVMPLAVTVRSAIDNLAPGSKLRIFVLDSGISEDSKQRLVQSWPEGRFQIEWVDFDAAILDGLPLTRHINLVTYNRLLIPRVLPADVQRAIYLDSDVLVRTDLTRLWNQDLSGQLSLAAQDVAAPWIDASRVLGNYSLCKPYLGATQPVPNFRQLALRPEAPYFNAGVLLVNVVGWRDCDLSARLLDCLQQNREHVLWQDQYALNVVLAGRWDRLDTRWNQGFQLFTYPSWKQSPFDEDEFERLRNDPFIVHFTTRFKPWRALCPHPFSGEFYKYLDRTAWAGWRPPRLKVFLEAVRIQERRLRRARKQLQSRLQQWMERRREAA